MASKSRGRLSLEEGKRLVLLARKSIKNYLQTGDIASPKSSSQSRGVFVTLESYPARKLRGCIGFPFPVKPLQEAVSAAAVAAAVNDARFEPVGMKELSRITVEVSVLSVPEEICYGSCEELARKIKIGRDGLVLEYGPHCGLLLPQVPVEYSWDVEKYLGNLCLKACLPQVFWKNKKPGISRFQAQIFSEKTPGGQVVEKKL